MYKISATPFLAVVVKIGQNETSPYSSHNHFLPSFTRINRQPLFDPSQGLNPLISPIRITFLALIASHTLFLPASFLVEPPSCRALLSSFEAPLPHCRILSHDGRGISLWAEGCRALCLFLSWTVFQFWVSSSGTILAPDSTASTAVYRDRKSVV